MLSGFIPYRCVLFTFLIQVTNHIYLICLFHFLSLCSLLSRYNNISLNYTVNRSHKQSFPTCLYLLYFACCTMYPLLLIQMEIKHYKWNESSITEWLCIGMLRNMCWNVLHVLWTKVMFLLQLQCLITLFLQLLWMSLSYICYSCRRVIKDLIDYCSSSEKIAEAVAHGLITYIFLFNASHSPWVTHILQFTILLQTIWLREQTEKYYKCCILLLVLCNMLDRVGYLSLQLP